MSQYFYDMSAHGYHDEQYPFKPNMSRPLKDYIDPLRQTTFEPSSSTYQQNEVWCAVCENSTHLTDDCPIIPAFKKVLYEQYNDTHTHNCEGMYYQNHEENHYLNFDAYHSESQFHPNFSWENDFVAPPQESFLPQPHSFQTNEGSSFVACQPPQGNSLEDTFNLFMHGQMEIATQMSKSQDQTISTMEDIRDQLTQLTQMLSILEPDHLPSQHISETHNVESLASDNESEGQEQDLEVTALRSEDLTEHLDNPGTVYPMLLDEVLDYSKLDFNEAWEEEEQNEKEEEGENTIEETLIEPEPPYPKRLTIITRDHQVADEYEVVDVVIPLLVIITPIFSITKLLEVLGAVQVKINKYEKGILKNQVNAIPSLKTFPREGVG